MNIRSSLLIKPFSLSVHTYARPDTKSFSSFNKIWFVGRGRWVIHDGMLYDPIQRQGLKVVKMTDFKVCIQGVYKFNWTNFQEISRFQEGFQEKSTCLHCFGLLCKCNVPNLLVCLNIEEKHDMHNMGAVAKIKSNQFLKQAIRYPVSSWLETNAVDHRHFTQKFPGRIQGYFQDFQELQTPCYLRWYACNQVNGELW